MERENKKKKRAREPTKKQPQEPKPKTKKQQQMKKKPMTTTTAVVAAAAAAKLSSPPPPPPSELGVFEFPWQKEEERRPIGESDGCDLRDVFFSSLVDGCSAAIGFPGDRISPLPAPIVFPEADDAVDCIWSCALLEPLPVYSKASRLA